MGVTFENRSGNDRSTSLPANYESWSAQRKQAFLWDERIVPSRYEHLPLLEKIDVLGLFLTLLRIKMDRHLDEVSPGWKKAIHTHGSVAKFRFIAAEDTPFTGLFQGADFGLIRLSVTGDPTDRGFAPGLAIKLFVNGQPSENVSALVSLTGQGKNYNFFAHEFSNIVPVVPEFGPKIINWIFSRVTRFPTKLYLQDMAEIDQNGQPETNPHYPYQIFLVPNSDHQFSSRPHDFREDLATLKSGTRLFSVLAVDPGRTGDTEAIEAIATIDSPTYRQQAKLIGYIELTSEFVASAYGDSRLFFRHQRFGNR